MLYSMLTAFDHVCLYTTPIKVRKEIVNTLVLVELGHGLIVCFHMAYSLMPSGLVTSFMILIKNLIT